MASCASTSHYPATLEESNLIDLFKKSDPDGNGTISRERLARVMKDVCCDTVPQISSTEFEAVLARTWQGCNVINYVEFVHWLAQGSRELPELPLAPAKPRRHLVLFFDINKTCIMSDRLAGKSEECIINEILANTSWGLSGESGWVLRTSEPTLFRPANADGPDAPELQSYAEHCERLHPGRDHRKLRTKLTTSFTKENQPGQALASNTADLVAKLRNADGTFQLLIPSFLCLLVELKKTRRSFSLCFRTFGEDMADVAAEMNLFCEGRHPMFYGHRMDGSDGDPDYRLHLSNPDVFGTFHRTSEVDSLVLGSLEQPGEGKYRDAEDKTLTFYDSISGVHKIISGREAIRKHFWDLHGKPGTSGFRDYFGFWKQQHNTSAGGKLFFYKPSRSTNRHEMFFDDNIRYNDAHIVQPVNVLLPNKKKRGRTFCIRLMSQHLCKVEPLQVIHDRMYFVKELAKLEDGYETHLCLCERIRRILSQFAQIHKDLKNSWSIRRSEDRLQWYDCWSGFRHEDHEISCTADDDEEGAEKDEVYIDPTRYVECERPAMLLFPIARGSVPGPLPGEAGRRASAIA